VRCGCPVCGTWMVHAEEERRCICPACGEGCDACLGTNSVMTKEAIRRIDPEALLQQEESEENEAF